jgi:hypothetical protein
LLTVDALFPDAVRDIHLRLAIEGMIEPYWTAEIFDEYRRYVLTSHPWLRPDDLDRSLQLLRDMFPEADILEYEAELDQLPREVPDRYTLAAAMAACVDAIIAIDRRRYPPELYSYVGISVLTPDMLLCRCLTKDPELVLQLLTEESVRRRLSIVGVVTALYPQAKQFAWQVMNFRYPGISHADFLAHMRQNNRSQGQRSRQNLDRDD